MRWAHVTITCGGLGLGLMPVSDAVFAADASGASKLVVATWGGVYGDAMTANLFKPFTSRTGIPVEPKLAGVDVAALATDAARPHIVDLPALEEAEACAKGLLAPIDLKTLPPGPGGVTAANDFLVQPDACSVPGTLTSEVVLYDRSKLGAHTPTQIADLFNTAAFPGKRALKRDAVGTLEWALLADNVSPANVYAVLGTPAGVERAFAKLDTIRGDVIWWSDSAKPVELLGRGDVIMAAVFGPRAAAAVIGAEHPFDVLWDRTLVSSNRWAVVKGAESVAGAREFLGFATDTPRLVSVGNVSPYGPARRSAARQITAERAALSPATPEHFAQAFVIDATFWNVHAAALRQRFETWLAAVQH